MKSQFFSVRSGCFVATALNLPDLSLTRSSPAKRHERDPYTGFRTFLPARQLRYDRRGAG